MQAAKQCSLLDWYDNPIVRTPWVYEAPSTDAALDPTAFALSDTATVAAAVSRAEDTDTAMKNSQTSTDPTVAARAAAGTDVRTLWLRAFPLEYVPSEEWVVAILRSMGHNVSRAEAPWLPTMIANYATLRHLLMDCVVAAEWSDAAFRNCGVVTDRDKDALQQWARTLWPPPAPPPPPPRDVAATAAVQAPLRVRLSMPSFSQPHCVAWPFAEINVANARPPSTALQTGSFNFAGVSVLVRFGPKAKADCKRAILFLAGCGGYSKELNSVFNSTVQRPTRWPTEWEPWAHLIVVAIPDSGGKQKGQSKNASAWVAPLPQWFESITGWLVDQGIYFALVGFSRGAAWSAQLFTKFPKNVTGVLLVAGYHTSQEKGHQLQAARDLLKPKVPVIIVHSMTDEFSNPNLHPEYWKTLLNAPIGRESDQRNENLIMLTIRRTSHGSLQKFAEGFPEREDLRPEAARCFHYLVQYLA